MRHRHAAAAALAFVAIAASTVDVAHAQPSPGSPSSSSSPSPSPSSTAMADGRARFEEGLKLTEQGQHDAARLKFSQAWAVIKAPAVLYNLARAEQLSGHSLEALQHFRMFAKMSDPKIDDAQRRAAADNIFELTKKLSQIDIQAPPHSRVSIDGREVDSDLSDPVPVLPGSHTVEAIADGKVSRVTVECTAGTVAKAKLVSDEPSSAEPTPAPSVTDQPPPEIPSEKRSTAGWVVPISLGAAGVAGLVVGGIFASASRSSKDESESMRRATPGLCAEPAGSACAAYDDKRSTAESQATAAWIGYVGGGVLVAAGVAAFVLWPTEGKKVGSGLRVMPVVGRREAGMGVGGAF